MRDWISILIKSISLGHYNSKAIAQRLRDPRGLGELTWDDDENEKQNTSILLVGATCTYARRPPKKRPLYWLARRARVHDGHLIRKNVKKN